MGDSLSHLDDLLVYIHYITKIRDPFFVHGNAWVTNGKL